MSEDKLGFYTKSVEKLRQVFANDDLSKDETSKAFSFTKVGISTDWIRRELVGLLQDLQPAGFNVDLRVQTPTRTYDVEAVLDNASVVLVPQTSTEENDHPELPESAVAVLDALNQLLRNVDEQSTVNISQFSDLFDLLSSPAVSTELQVTIYHDKSGIAELTIPYSSSLNTAIYFFPDAFIRFLQSFSQKPFINLESELFSVEKRTVIFLIGFKGFLASDFLAICGGDSFVETQSFLSNPDVSESFAANNGALKFRNQESYWNNHNTWVTPYFFDWKVKRITSAGQFTHELQAYQVLLAVLFLADLVEFHQNSYVVEFTGLTRKRLEINQLSFVSHADLETVFELFKYSYQGFLPDKLELTQQFICLMISDQESWLDKASEIQIVTEKSFAKGLGAQAQRYFEARQKLIDHINDVAAETSESILDLKRDQASDLYKAVGVAAAAYLGVIAKPELSTISVVLAVIVISIYLLIVLLNTLPALKIAFDLRFATHENYIEGLSDSITDTEKTSFLGDTQLGKSKRDFQKVYNSTSLIYWCLLLGVIVFGAILTRISLSSTVPTPKPTPIIVITPTQIPTDAPTAIFTPTATFTNTSTSTPTPP